MPCSAPDGQYRSYAGRYRTFSVFLCCWLYQKYVARIRGGPVFPFTISVASST